MRNNQSGVRIPEQRKQIAQYCWENKRYEIDKYLGLQGCRDAGESLRAMTGIDIQEIEIRGRDVEY